MGKINHRAEKKGHNTVNNTAGTNSQQPYTEVLVRDVWDSVLERSQVKHVWLYEKSETWTITKQVINIHFTGDTVGRNWNPDR